MPSDLAEAGEPDAVADAPQRARRATRPLLRLLAFAGPHRGWAVLTVAFGTLGFLLSFVYPWIVGSVVDLATSAAPLVARRRELLRLTELSALTGVGHALVLYGRGHCNVHLTDGIIADLRRRLFEHLQLLSVRFYTKERIGSILARVLHDVHDATAILYLGVFVAALDALQLAVAFALLWRISPRLTVACIAVFPLYGIVFAAMNPRVRRASEQLRAQLCRISGNMAEQLSGQALVKTYTAEEREARRFSADVAEHHALVCAQSHAGHLVSAWGEVLVHLGTTIIVGYGGWLVLDGALTPGLLTRFLGFVVILFGPVRRFADLNIAWQSSLSAIRRVFAVLEIRPSIVERPHARRTPPTIGHVRFEDVRFRYGDGSDEARARLDDDGDAPTADDEERAPWVLDGVTLEARAGERVAVVGISGAGKTTLLSLVPRLYDAGRGRVLVDGVDVRDYALTALRSAVAIVQQDSFIFSGSVRDNIAYGRPDASDDEVRRAAEAANAHEFIARLPDGYATALGERGVNLSGGQRQRISIARALLKDPRILILDEATSALDSESEAVVQRALETLMRGRTSLVIAHRLSTVRSADRIVVLEDGRIRESGTHDELVARADRYAAFLRAQGAGR